jgi:hypothetical protein
MLFEMEANVWIIGVQFSFFLEVKLFETIV